MHCLHLYVHCSKYFLAVKCFHSKNTDSLYFLVIQWLAGWLAGTSIKPILPMQCFVYLKTTLLKLGIEEAMQCKSKARGVLSYTLCGQLQKLPFAVSFILLLLTFAAIIYFFFFSLSLSLFSHYLLHSYYI